MLRILLLSLCLVPGLVQAQAIEFPSPPSGQVVDDGDWLGAERRAQLESELGRYRESYEIDVMVVMWDRSLPPETNLEELADRIGETWGRNDMWVVVLHVPESLHRPAVVAGGEGMESLREEAIVEALHNAVVRGMKERTTRAQVEALGLEAGEEFIFLRHRALLERKAHLAQRKQAALDAETRHQSMIFRAVMVTILALLGVAGLAALYLFKRRPKNLEFPNTRWRQRLGAKWCGGGHIVVSLPPPTRIP